MKERGTTGAGRPQITGLQVHRHLERTHGRGTTGNIFLIGRTSGIRPLRPRAVIHGSMVTDGGEVIPSFNGTDFRQKERRVRLFVSIHEWLQREGLVNFWSDSKDGHSIRVKESWKHRRVLRIYLIT